MFEVIVYSIVSVLFSGINVYYWEWRNARLSNCGNKWAKPYIPHSKISRMQSIVMLILIIVFSIALEYIYRDNSIVFNLKRIALISILFPIALSDYKEHIIPNTALMLALMYWLILTGLDFILESDMALKYFIQEVIFMFIFFGILLLCSVILRGGIGMGDVKLIMVMALLEGSGGIMSSVTTSLFILLITAVVMLLSRRKKAKDFIPFAPAVLLGSYISILMTGA